jgi:hypothetical protein
MRSCGHGVYRIIFRSSLCERQPEGTLALSQIDTQHSVKCTWTRAFDWKDSIPTSPSPPPPSHRLLPHRRASSPDLDLSS